MFYKSEERAGKRKVQTSLGSHLCRWIFRDRTATSHHPDIWWWSNADTLSWTHHQGSASIALGTYGDCTKLWTSPWRLFLYASTWNYQRNPEAKNPSSSVMIENWNKTHSYQVSNMIAEMAARHIMPIFWVIAKKHVNGPQFCATKLSKLNDIWSKHQAGNDARQITARFQGRILQFLVNTMKLFRRVKLPKSPCEWILQAVMICLFLFFHLFTSCAPSHDLQSVSLSIAVQYLMVTTCCCAMPHL